MTDEPTIECILSMEDGAVMGWQGCRVFKYPGCWWFLWRQIVGPVNSLGKEFTDTIGVRSFLGGNWKAGRLITASKDVMPIDFPLTV